MLDDCGHIELVALEVDDAQRLLVATANAERSQASVAVAATALIFAFGQLFDRLALPQLGAVN